MLTIFGKTYGIDKKALEKVASLSFEYLADDFEINLSFACEGEIQALNARYRGKDEPTDILSFKLEETEGGGDIVICLPLVETEAKKWQMSLPDAVCWMLVHGILHLAGYDHTNGKDRVKMEAAEAKILENVGIRLDR